MAFTQAKSENGRSPSTGATKARDDSGTDGRSPAFVAVLRKRRNLAERASANSSSSAPSPPALMSWPAATAAGYR
jgi:hypothetical protein